MTSQQSNSADSGNREFPFTEAPNATMETEHNSLEAIKGSLGGRLRAAREARGLDVETCAHALRLPTRVLRQIESNEYGGIDHHVYLGSYLTKYARYLGVDEDEVKLELERIRPPEPALVATGGISHSRYLLENYARAATYVVLTAAIVVPTIWLGVRGTLDRDVSHGARHRRDVRLDALRLGALPRDGSTTGHLVCTLHAPLSSDRLAVSSQLVW